MIEVEKRVLLNQRDLKGFLGRINKSGIKVKEFKRFTMVNVAKSDFTPDKDNIIDLKIRTTKEASLFTIKKGNWHSSSARQENEIHFNREEIKELVSMMKSLDFLYYVVTYVTRKQFQYQDFIVTIDYYHHVEEFMAEIELLVTNQSEVTDAEKRIETFVSQHNLVPLDSEGTVKFISKLNSIKETQIDFTKISVDEWFKIWEGYINCDI